jgi:hypothetical protein
MPNYGVMPIVPREGGRQCLFMQQQPEIEVEAQDKLRWLRRLDRGREWKFLDDQRCCRSCGKIFTGRQAKLVGGTRPFGPVRVACPTADCRSTPVDWLYPHEATSTVTSFSKPKIVRVRSSRHVLNARNNHRERDRYAHGFAKLRHAFHFLQYLGLRF